MKAKLKLVPVTSFFKGMFYHKIFAKVHYFGNQQIYGDDGDVSGIPTCYYVELMCHHTICLICLSLIFFIKPKINNK